MEVIEAAKNNIGYLLLTVIGGAGIISMALAAWTAMMAHGDPQQMAKARNAFFGGIVGLLLGGFAFAIPQILSETVLKPSGGQGFGTQEAGSCDDILRRELILQPNANTSARMNQVIRVIQQREEDCLSDNWDPEAIEGAGLPSSPSGFDSGDVRGECFGGGFDGNANAPNDHVYTVDGIEVPSRMIVEEKGAGGGGSNAFTVPHKDSVRDVNDNILIYFADGNRPTDLSRCWMFLSRDQLWVAAQ